MHVYASVTHSFDACFTLKVVVTMVRKLVIDAKLPMEHFQAMEATIAMTWKSAGDALRVKFQAMPNGEKLPLLTITSKPLFSTPCSTTHTSHRHLLDVYRVCTGRNLFEI